MTITKTRTTHSRRSAAQPALPTRETVMGERALRVLQVTPRYFPYMGGVENHVYQVSRRFAQLGTDVTVLTADPTGNLPPYEVSEGVKIQRVRSWPAKEDFYFAPDVYRVITRGNWDVVHVQSYLSLVAPIGMLAAARAGIPYVVTFHGGGHSSSLRNAIRGTQQAILRPLLARADRLVATARFEIPFFSRRLRVGTEKFVLIPNGADLPKVTQTSAAQSTETLIVSMGRLERYKGHHRVLAALPHVLKQRPDVRLWLAGSGPYEPELRRMAQELGVAAHVDIHAIPAAERQKMADELSRAALVVLLSDYETHPMAILEALALGRPALVADSSGLSELAENGFARAISLKSTPTQVAAAIMDQLQRPLVPAALSLPTWDDCAADLLALYGSVMKETLCAS